MRNFFYRNQPLTSCGTGGGKGGIIFICPHCGDAWGKVSGVANFSQFIPLCNSCEQCPPYISRPPGSFLTPLIWWDFANGNKLSEQLSFADQKLLTHEALMLALALLRHPGKELRYGQP